MFDLVWIVGRAPGNVCLMKMTAVAFILEAERPFNRSSTGATEILTGTR
jgi:hypothetical protein